MSQIHPIDPLGCNDLAWVLATATPVELRNPTRAVQLAAEAVKAAPQNGTFWNTQGVARYRTADFKAAIGDLEKSIQLRNGGDAFDFFFLAMASQKLNDAPQARKWFDQAVQWMENNACGNAELIRFRAEAAEVLGLPATRPATAPTTRP